MIISKKRTEKEKERAGKGATALTVAAGGVAEQVRNPGRGQAAAAT